MRAWTIRSYAVYAPGNTGRADTRTVHQCCFECPLDDCDQTHPDCPIREGVHHGDVEIETNGTNLYRADVKVNGYLTTRQAGKLLGIAPETVAHRCQRGTLPGRKVGNRWLIPRGAIDNV